ncbi:MAG: glycine betaine ABC transporter substrate-binding protein [Granulosicoccus sp.]
MKKRRICAMALLAVLACSSFVSSHAANAEAVCGEISVGQMNWPSAELIAEIDRIILSAGYGCEVQLVSGDSLSTLLSMIENGTPDIAPVLWVDAVRESLDSAVSEGLLAVAAEVLPDGAEEGWWIPAFIARQHPQIRTVNDVLERPDLFPSVSDEESEGIFYNCPDGWKACQISNTNLFKAYNAAEKGFTLTDPGSVAGLDASIAKAAQREVGWFGYYWAPTATLGRYDMVKLETVEHDEEHWAICTAVPDCEEPRVNGWAKNEIFSVVAADFAREHPAATEYLNTRHWQNDVMNKLLAWMADNQATGSEAADYFLQNYEDIWTPWVSGLVVSRIRRAVP